MDRLRESGQSADVDLLVGAPDYQLGDERVVSRPQLIDAVTRLLPEVRKLPGSSRLGCRDNMATRRIVSPEGSAVY